MIKKKIQQEVEKREAMRGGTGEITIRHYFRPEEIKARLSPEARLAPPCGAARTRLCSELVLPPGASIGLHDHVEEDEIYIIQKGEGLMTDSGSPVKQDEARPSSQGGREFSVEAGDAILTGQGASHSIKNTGSEDLVVTAIIIKY